MLAANSKIEEGSSTCVSVSSVVMFPSVFVPDLVGFSFAGRTYNYTVHLQASLDESKRQTAFNKAEKHTVHMRLSEGVAVEDDSGFFVVFTISGKPSSPTVNKQSPRVRWRGGGGVFRL